jgi:hypothetical protein
VKSRVQRQRAIRDAGLRAHEVFDRYVALSRRYVGKSRRVLEVDIVVGIVVEDQLLLLTGARVC